MHPAQNVVVWSVLAEQIKLRPSTKNDRKLMQNGGLFERDEKSQSSVWGAVALVNSHFLLLSDTKTKVLQKTSEILLLNANVCAKFGAAGS